MFDKTHNHQLPNAGRTNMHDPGMAEATTLPIPLSFHKHIENMKSEKSRTCNKMAATRNVNREMNSPKVTSVR
jgi:hypothetical protein